MHLISFLAVILLLFGCSSDDLDSSNIVGKWKLVQVLADPGDGSGTFVNIESNKTITFFSDNTFSSNEYLCSFSPLAPLKTGGTFSTEKREIYPNSCESFAEVKLSYRIENKALIVSYFCIEGCAEKYVKIE